MKNKSRTTEKIISNATFALLLFCAPLVLADEMKAPQTPQIQSPVITSKTLNPISGMDESLKTHRINDSDAPQEEENRKKALIDELRQIYKANFL